jgi:hypothetical protein
MWNISGTQDRAPFVFSGPLGYFKQALDHEKRWRIEQLRISTYQNRKCGISLEHANTHLSSLFALKTAE